MCAQDAPVFAPPVSYRLVWRAVTTNPVVVWKPEPAEGYMAMGCLVSSTLAYPPPDSVLCVRADRVGPAALARHAVWSYNPQQFLLESAIPSACGVFSWFAFSVCFVLCNVPLSLYICTYVDFINIHPSTHPSIHPPTFPSTAPGMPPPHLPRSQQATLTG